MKQERKYEIVQHGQDHSFVIDGRIRVLQIHPPKTAGTSFSQTIGFKDHHHTLTWFFEKFLGEYRASYSYGIIRNPWDRIESWWRYRQHMDDPSFNEWGESGFINQWNIKNEIDNVLCQEEWIEHKGIPKLNMLIRFEELDKGYDQLVRILGIRDKVGKLEHLNKNAMYPRNTEIIWSESAYKKSLPLVGAFADKYGYKFEGKIV